MPEDDATRSEAAPAAGQSASSAQPVKGVFLVSYPKVVFLYPTFLTALGAGIYMLFAGETEGTGHHVAGLVFLTVAAVNMVVFSFDFPRTTSLTLFFFLVAVVVGLWATFRLNPDLLPAALDFLLSLNPSANATFYFMFAGVLGLIFIGVAISVQFDYWEIRPNELLHHHGILSNLKRYSAPSLRIEKEINDVFEYLLLRSGRLILHPTHEPRAIVLDNVFFISSKEREITQLLGALQVQVRSGDGR